MQPGRSRRSATWDPSSLTPSPWKPYPDVYPPSSTDRWGIASETMFIDRLDREIADIVLRRIGTADATHAMVQMRVLGGAFARSATGSTALGHRGRPALMWLLTAYQDLEQGAGYHTWTRSFRDELALKSRGTYLNFLETPDAAALAAAYEPETFARLAAIKRTYDPGDLFHPAASIEPAP